MNRWQVLVRVVGVAVVVSVYWWAPLVLRPMSFFGVRRVQVVGARYLAADAVVQAMALRPEASVFDNLRDVEARLATLGGIATVSVQRILPATLRVAITEEEPVALAKGPDGLVPLAKDARPLPYDVERAPVDAPIVQEAEPRLVSALWQVQTTDLGLFAEVSAAHVSGGEVVLDMAHGLVRLDLPVDPEIVRSVSAVRADLDARRVSWRELDGRFRGWVVVRGDRGRGTGDRQVISAAASPSRRGSAATSRSPVPRPRSPARRPAA